MQVYFNDADIKELEAVIALLRKRNNTVKHINPKAEADKKSEQALLNILNAIKQNQSVDDVILWYGAFNYVTSSLRANTQVRGAKKSLEKLFKHESQT